MCPKQGCIQDMKLGRAVSVKFEWKQKYFYFYQVNAFENVIYKMAAILL